MSVGLNLCQLAEQPAVRSSPEIFLRKLGSLVRLALSAALQKRDFLRRHTTSRPLLARGFLLDRARLVLVPVGLEAAVRLLRGRDLTDEGPGLEFARQVVQRLHEASRQDGRAVHLETVLGSAEGFAGLRLSDPPTPLRQQLRTLGQLHAVGKIGTGVLFGPADKVLAPEEVTDLLRVAWKQTEIVRLVFLRYALPPPRTAALWKE